MSHCLLFMVKLSEKTYWKVGGFCEHFRTVETESELKEQLGISSLKKVIIGNGTNVLFDSEGYNGQVIKLGENFDFINQIDDNEFEVGASTWIPKLVRTLSSKGFGGIEHCVGIPATVGGLVAMNGGSQRRSISENLISVYAMNSAGNIIKYDISDCNFSYRHSNFKNSGMVILKVRLKLNKISNNGNRKELLKILKERRTKFPRKLPSCGSVFLSSSELYEKVGAPGFVVESLGLKGMGIGGAQISPLHANFIVNNSNATSMDILKLVSTVNTECKLKYGFKLEAEALYYSQDMDGVSLDKAAEKYLG